MICHCAHSRFDLQTLGTFKYESRLGVTLSAMRLFQLSPHLLGCHQLSFFRDFVKLPALSFCRKLIHVYICTCIFVFDFNKYSTCYGKDYHKLRMLRFQRLWSCLRVQISLLKTKRTLLYLKTQFVPSSKHFPPRL